jgi:mono/diheme cytochrome c family protein
LLFAGLAHAGAQDGAQIFSRSCARCHGASGHGDGEEAADLKTHPRDLTKVRLPAARVTRVVHDGGAAVGKSHDMPAFGGKLTAEEIAAVTAYVESLGGQEP